jgi:hypothetical protein
VSERRDLRCEHTRAKRDNEFAAIIHCSPDNLRNYNAKSRQGRQTGDFPGVSITYRAHAGFVESMDSIGVFRQ